MGIARITLDGYEVLKANYPGMMTYSVTKNSRSHPQTGNDIVEDEHRILSTEEGIRKCIQDILAEKGHTWKWTGNAYVAEPQNGMQLTLQYEPIDSAGTIDWIVLPTE